MIHNTFPPKMTCTVVSTIRIHPTLPMVSTRPLPPSPAVHLLDVTPLPNELVGADTLVAGAAADGETSARVVARTGGHRTPSILTKLA